MSRSAPISRPVPRSSAALVITLLAVVLALTIAAAVSADEARTREEWGRLHYRVHCLNCHGDDGRGDGPVAEVLTLEPSDLTLIAQRNGGEFPGDEVYAVIDGREKVRSHGRRDMPVWGLSFQDRGRDSDQEGEVSEKILDLLAYLESIQAE